jgi:hypothetical protein
MADRGKGKGNGGRETPRGNRPSPYPPLVNGIFPISDAVTPPDDDEIEDLAEQFDMHQGEPAPDGVFSSGQLRELNHMYPPPPPPPPPALVMCTVCGQQTRRPLPNNGYICLNPACSAYNRPGIGTYPGHVRQAELDREAERCKNGRCNVMGGTKRKKKKKKKKKSRRR